jgi:hypothetical protein
MNNTASTARSDSKCPTVLAGLHLGAARRFSIVSGFNKVRSLRRQQLQRATRQAIRCGVGSSTNPLNSSRSMTGSKSLKSVPPTALRSCPRRTAVIGAWTSRPFRACGRTCASDRPSDASRPAPMALQSSPQGLRFLFSNCAHGGARAAGGPYTTASNAAAGIASPFSR